MKLSIATGTLTSYIRGGMTDFEALKAVRGAGFKVVDYSITQHNTDNCIEDGRKLRGYLSELGMSAWQAHTLDAYPVNPDIELRQRRAEEALRFCGAAGIERVVVHPSAWDGNTRTEFLEGNYSFYRSLIPLCEQTGVKVLIENIGNPFDPFFLVDGRDLAELVDGVGSPWFEAVWDTGHANHFDPKLNSQYRSILDLGSRLTAIHFNDNLGAIKEEERHLRMDMHMAPYMSWMGSVNYDAILRGLKDIGYKGTLNFEITPTEPRPHVESLIIDGEKAEKLNVVPLSVWTKIYSAVYEIGKFMLETYGLFEE